MLATDIQLMCGFGSGSWTNLSKIVSKCITLKKREHSERAAWTTDTVSINDKEEMWITDTISISNQEENVPTEFSKMEIPKIVQALVTRSNLTTMKAGNGSWAVLSSGYFADQQCEIILDRV